MTGESPYLAVSDDLLNQCVAEFRRLPKVGTGKISLTFEFNCNTNGIGTVKIKHGDERDLIPKR